MAKMKILVIEPEPAIVRLIEVLLLAEDYEVSSSADLRDEAYLSGVDADLILIDIVPPYQEGIGMLHHLRASSAAPIVAMSTSDDAGVRLAILESGADDFLTVPFDPDQLLSHVRFLLAEQDEVDSEQMVLNVGSIEVDFKRRIVRVDDDPVGLSYSEWVLLECLAGEPGHPCLTSELLMKVWGVGAKHDYKFLTSWIQRLQSKLGCDPANPRLIRPYHDVGFVLSP